MTKCSSGPFWLQNPQLNSLKWPPTGKPLALSTFSDNYRPKCPLAPLLTPKSPSSALLPVHFFLFGRFSFFKLRRVQLFWWKAAKVSLRSFLRLLFLDLHSRETDEVSLSQRFLFFGVGGFSPKPPTRGLHPLDPRFLSFFIQRVLRTLVTSCTHLLKKGVTKTSQRSSCTPYTTSRRSYGPSLLVRRCDNAGRSPAGQGLWPWPYVGTSSQRNRRTLPSVARWPFGPLYGDYVASLALTGHCTAPSGPRRRAHGRVRGRARNFLRKFV